MSVSRNAHAYARLRNALAPWGPQLSRLGPLRRVIRRLDGRVLPPGEVQVTTAGGWPIWINPGDQAVARTLIATGSWQPAEVALIADAMPKDGVAIDVGANIGYVTGVLATKTGAAGRVLAFEPDGTNFGLLERTVTDNGWSHVVLRRAACGDQPGSLRLHKDPDNWGNHSLARDAELHGDESVSVEVVTLDDSASDLSRLDVLKIDVQGWELAVLRGAGTLKRFGPTVFIEFFPRGLHAAGTEPADLWAEMETWGDITAVQRGGTTRPITLAEALGDPSEPSRNVDLMVRPR